MPNQRSQNKVHIQAFVEKELGEPLFKFKSYGFADRTEMLKELIRIGLTEIVKAKPQGKKAKRAGGGVESLGP